MTNPHQREMTVEELEQLERTIKRECPNDGYSLYLRTPITDVMAYRLIAAAKQGMSHHPSIGHGTENDDTQATEICSGDSGRQASPRDADGVSGCAGPENSGAERNPSGSREIPKSVNTYIDDQPENVNPVVAKHGMTGWRDILLAPRNGTRVLLWCPKMAGSKYLIATWIGMPRYPWSCPGGDAIGEDQPTHFMLLPPPPTTVEKDDVAGGISPSDALNCEPGSGTEKREHGLKPQPSPQGEEEARVMRAVELGEKLIGPPPQGDVGDTDFLKRHELKAMGIPFNEPSPDIAGIKERLANPDVWPSFSLNAEALRVIEGLEAKIEHAWDCCDDYQKLAYERKQALTEAQGRIHYLEQRHAHDTATACETIDTWQKGAAEDKATCERYRAALKKIIDRHEFGGGHLQIARAALAHGKEE